MAKQLPLEVLCCHMTFFYCIMEGLTLHLEFKNHVITIALPQKMFTAQEAWSLLAFLHQRTYIKDIVIYQ